MSDLMVVKFGASGWVAGYARLFLAGLGLAVVLDYFPWVGWFV